MKILQVVATLGSGGAEHFVVELTKELTRKGYVCDVLTLFKCDNNNILREQLKINSVQVVSLDKNLGFDIKCYFRLYRFIKEGGYDVIHAHVGAIPYILLSTIRLKYIKFVATIHSEARREAGKNISKWSRFFMFRTGLCTPVSISEKSKASFFAYYKFNASLVYNGVSFYEKSKKLSLRDNDNQLLFVHPASCQTVKNQQLLFKAFSKLSAEYNNIKLLWMGNNNTFCDLFDSLKVIMPNTVHYLGVVPNVRDYLAEADAMCLSSKMEGMPMTIIEAFSVGCPPLCTPVGGIVNMVDNGNNGMLSDDISVESYYKMLKSFCEKTTEERRQMKANAKLSFSKYSIENSVKGYLKIYKS